MDLNLILLLLIITSAITILSIISITTAPIIGGLIGNDWGTKNCEKESDLLNYYKNQYSNPTEEQQKDINNQKKELNKCRRDKAMYSLEYASLIIDVVLNSFCFILSLLHFLEIGESFKKKTGIFAIFTGVVGFFLTFAYLIFSLYIFNNDHNETKKLYENGAYLKLFDNDRYLYSFTQTDIDKDPNVIYAKYKDLGKKQYNYDRELFINSLDTGSAIYNCRYYTSIGGYPGDLYGYNTNRKYQYNHVTEDCLYLWEDTGTVEVMVNTSIKNKYIYDRWITTIILGFAIIICSLCLSFLGFLLILEQKELSEETNGQQTIKQEE